MPILRVVFSFLDALRHLWNPKRDSWRDIGWCLEKWLNDCTCGHSYECWYNCLLYKHTGRCPVLLDTPFQGYDGETSLTFLTLSHLSPSLTSHLSLSHSLTLSLSHSLT